MPRDRAPRIVDLGTGRGSNVRYLEPYVAQRFRAASWLLVDADPALLSEAKMKLPHVDTRRMDLGTLDANLFEKRDLVTGSALLDLVSERWLESLARHCLATGAVVLFALNYNGESDCTPEEPEDEMIRALMNRHQRQNDKGFGRAAGPDASAIATKHFEAVGYDVRREASDWRLPPESRELQRQLIEGWAAAALELEPHRSATIHDWLVRRLAHVDAGRSHITVGHDDLAAWQP